MRTWGNMGDNGERMERIDSADDLMDEPVIEIMASRGCAFHLLAE